MTRNKNSKATDSFDEPDFRMAADFRMADAETQQKAVKRYLSCAQRPGTLSLRLALTNHICRKKERVLTDRLTT